MFEDLIDSFRELFDPSHTHYMVVIGIIIIIVVLAAYIFKKIGIPEALGFIIMGILIGPSVLNLVTTDMITGESKLIFQTVTGVALGFIGFHIGNEIKISKVKKDFKSYTAILLGQAIVAFVLIFLGIIGWVMGFLGNKAFHLAILIAAVALPTAPAITASVVKESECVGPTTSTLLFVIGLDDIIGIIAVEFSLSMSLMYYNQSAGAEAVIGAILEPIINIIGSILIGLILGIIFAFILNRVKKTTLTIEFFVGTLLAIVGITEVLGWSELLACMTFGFILGNMQTDRNERAIRYGEQIFSPIVLLFFVLAGASMNIQAMFANWLVIVIAVTQVITRLSGKWIGAYSGAVLAKSSEPVKKFVGPGLFAQGEMTIGLSIMIYNTFLGISENALPGSPAATAASDGSLVLNVLGLSILIFQIIGPFATKWGLGKAGEIPDYEKEKIPIWQRIKIRTLTLLSRIGVGVESFPLNIEEGGIEEYGELSPHTVGDVAADVATGAIVGLATPAAIEAAIPAAAEAAAQAALKAVIEAVSQKGISSALEAPLEEISNAVKHEVGLAVGEAVGEAVTSAITSPKVIHEVGEAVEGAISETMQRAEEIDELDVSELMDETEISDLDACEYPLESSGKGPK
ncbi:MAG: cation:proton antiporter, partial [Candidatus Thorarchaeota archaeon]